MTERDQCQQCGRYLFTERDADRVNEVLRLRAALERITKIPYYQGVWMQEVAAAALKKADG